MKTRKTLAAAAITAATVAVLAACGDDDDTPAPAMTHGSSATSSPAGAAVSYNDADVMFLQMMYPHHAQAVDMAKLVPQRTQNQQIHDLASAIEKAQAPEMEQITTLLKQFGKPAPSKDMPHAGHGASSDDGMMTPAQMTALTAASGPTFDKMFLQMMIEHHTGAIKSAQTEIKDGKNTDTKALAQNIVTTQQKEIDHMRGLLGPA